jgi:hypothetical protein
MQSDYAFDPIPELDISPGRPFTSRERAAADLRSLNQAAAKLRPLLMARGRIPPAPRPLALDIASPAGGETRLILCDLEALLDGRDRVVVGFFGDRRRGADSSRIESIDARVVAELAAFPEVLCYCSFRLEDGNYGNLVLLRDDAGREHWRSSPSHQYAAAEVAPDVYESVRLHNGLMPGGLAAGQIHLTRTKYFDYRDGLWCGVRDYPR